MINMNLIYEFMPSSVPIKGDSKENDTPAKQKKNGKGVGGFQ